MTLLHDTRNVLATFAGIAIVLYGSQSTYASIQNIGSTYQSQNQATQVALEVATTQLAQERMTTEELRTQVDTLTVRQADLEQQLVKALEAAGLKAEAERVMAQDAQRAQDAANAQAKLEEKQRLATQQKTAQDAAAKALADAKAAAEAKALADAKAAAEAEAKKAAQAAADQNATKPSRRTRAS